MRLGKVPAIVLGGVGVALMVGSAGAQQRVIPADTPVEIRLTERVSTQHSKKGTAFHAILAAPVVLGDEVVLPLGSRVDGTVMHVNGVGLGLGHETSSIGLTMEQVTLPDGTRVPLRAKVAQIENSREVINKQGRIAGVRSTSTLSHRASGVVGTLAFSNPVALIFTTASSASLLRFSDPEISLPANAELVLVTTEAVEVGAVETAGTPVLAETPAARAALRRLVREQPFRTVTDPKHVPSDLTNLMFVGDGAALLRAFAAAGWMEVDSLDARSTYRTIRSVSEQQGYRTAPMSTLLLEGERPQYALAKTLDTFSKRHHLRIYGTREQWEGERVWVSSSTQDIGIGFSAAQKNFIHQIDHNIDHERSKVVNDLLLTGCVSGLNLVARPWMPKKPKNGTGEEIETDGRMAVVRLTSCTAPAHVPSPEQTAQIPLRENGLVQATRQTTLTLRNMMLRDNAFFMAYGGIKTGLGVKHPKPPEQPLETASVVTEQRYALGADSDAGGLEERRPAAEETETATQEEEPRATLPGGLPPFTVELGLHGGFAGYAGGNGGVVGYGFTPVASSDPAYLLALGNEHNDGWTLGGSVTLDTRAHLAHEFSFDYNRTGFMLEFADVDLSSAGGTTDPTTAANFGFREVALSTTEVAYALQYLPLRRESRWRPYVSVGPSLRLMHLTDAPITRASPWFRLGLGTIGSLAAAYEFGSTPPLEGGGLFQPGLQYGAGVKYRVSRHVLVRADYKETLTSQPDFWTKSKNNIFDPADLPGYSLSIAGPFMAGAMRQQRITMGASFIF